ncbi:MAG TPA: TonB-dependent receptor, partial [Spongiibacteraceae bacterium]|nr:TonB-dependent receptor [Spongiibacteraceae bacterium]
RDQANPSALGGDYQKNVETWRLASKTQWDIDERSSLEFGLSFEKQALYHPIVDKIMVDFDGAGPNPPQEVYSLLVDTDHRDSGAMLRYNLQLGEHNLLAGVNYGDNAVDGGNYRNDGGHRNGLSERVDNSATSLETYLVDRWQIAHDWTVIYGTQWASAYRDVRTTDVAIGDVRNPNSNYSSINPRLGTIYNVAENAELFASVSRLFEAPTNFELDDDVRGNNTTLDPMQGTVYEVGSRGHAALGAASRWNWEVSVYYARIRDEILSVDDPSAPGTSLSTNIGNTTHAGVETLVGASFALDAAATQRIEPLLSLTLNDFSFDNDVNYRNNDLPAAPNYIARGELLYRNTNGFFAGPTFDFIGRRHTDFSNSEKLGSYALLGLRSGYAQENWEVFAELRNLFDRDYIATVSVLDRAETDSANLNPGAPRSIYVGGRVKF